MVVAGRVGAERRASRLRRGRWRVRASRRAAGTGEVLDLDHALGQKPRLGRRPKDSVAGSTASTAAAAATGSTRPAPSAVTGARRGRRRAGAQCPTRTLARAAGVELGPCLAGRARRRPQPRRRRRSCRSPRRSAARVRAGPGVRRGERHARRDEVGLGCAVRRARETRSRRCCATLGIRDRARSRPIVTSRPAAGRRRSLGRVSAGHGEDGDGALLGAEAAAPAGRTLP